MLDVDYAVVLWSLLAGLLIAVLLYLKFGRNSNENDNDVVPNLFERINSMKAEESSVIRPRLLSTNSQSSSTSSSRRKKKSSTFDSKQKTKNFNSISDLLLNLGLNAENNLQEIYEAFEPFSIGPNVNLNTLINVQETILLVQSGEVRLSVKTNGFEVSKIIQDGGIVYSKLSVIKYLINSPNRPEDVPSLETTKPCVLLKLPFRALKSRLEDDIILSSINGFIAELKKITIDLLHGELALPMSAMYKEHKLLPNENIAAFMAKRFNVPDEDFFKARLVKFHIDTGEIISIYGQTHDIGIALITKGSVQVEWTNNEVHDQGYVIKDSWYGFICLLSSSRGEPFPKSTALEPTEGYILTRSTFQEMIQTKKDILKICALKMLKRVLPFTLKLYYFFNWLTVKSGTVLYNEADPPNGAYGVIRGRVRRLGEELQEDSLICGVYDCILQRPRTDKAVVTRSSELCFLSNEIIKAFKYWFPTVQNMLLKAMGEKLFDAWKDKTVPNKKSTKKSSLRVKAITVFGATDDIPMSKMASDLVAGIKLTNVSVIKISSRRILQWNKAFVQHKDFDPETNPHLLAWLRDQERSFDVLVYQCDHQMTFWTKWCLSEADIVLDFCWASKGSMITSHEDRVFKISHCEISLVLLHSPETLIPRGTADWLNRRKSWVSSHYHIKLSYSGSSNCRIDMYSDFARLGRSVLGLDIGLVLGGGGARGAAHVGLMKVLEEVSIPIDRIGGVSIGSFIGGLWAIHRNFDKVESLAKEWFALIKYGYIGHIKNFTYPHNSMFTGDYFNDTVKKIIGEHIMIEDLWIPYFCCTTDISSLGQRIHKSGWLWRYCRASMSYAWLLPPICDPRDGHLLIDGCYTENVPGKVMKKESKVKYVLVSDIAAIDDRDLTNFGDSLNGFWAKIKRDYWPFGTQVKIPDSEDIQLRLAFCLHYKNLDELKNDSDYEYICPVLGSYTARDFHKFEEIYRLGYNHANAYFAGMRKFK